LYKGGKLTASAKAKLQKRLEAENAKPKVSKSAARSKRTTPAASKPSTASANRKGVDLEEEMTAELVVAPSASASHSQSVVATKKRTKTKASELTLDDIVDTPRRSKLVAARNEAMNENKDVNWISLIGYNQIEAENEEALYSKLNRESNERFRSDLDGQCRINSQQKRAADGERAAYRNALNSQFKGYRAEDDRKMARKHALTQSLKVERRKQVEAAAMKRKYAELKKAKHELVAVQRLKAALSKEQREKAEKKELNMAKLKDMLIDNERQKALKEEQRLKEEEEAIRLQAEYAVMLKEQEEKRGAALRLIQAKQQQKFKALINATEGVREQAQRDAERADIEMARRQRAADQKEEAKRRRQREDQKERERAIDRQINDKMEKIRADILEDKAYGVKVDKLHTEYLQEIEDKRTEKLRKQQEQAVYLQAQIDEQEQAKKESATEMSESEKNLNKKLLDKVRNLKTSPNKREVMMKQMDIQINPKAPFQWRYAYRKAPF